MTGTIVNIAAVAAGGGVGLLLGQRLKARYMDVVFQAIGLVTICIGVSMSLLSHNMIITALSIIGGILIGEWMGIEQWLERLADRLKASVKINSERFSTALVTSSVLYCVGSMAILGSFEDGLGEFPRLLYTKSIMDGVVAIALAASLGVGVLFSVIPILIYQGTLTLLATALSGVLSEAMVAEMSAAGGVMLVGIGITILGLKKISVANMLPALPIAVVLAWLFGSI